MIYHITTRTVADALRTSGTYAAESLAQEGFIHFSARDQILGVANAFYRGVSDLVILVVDPDRLSAPLKWEAPVHPSQNADAPLPADTALFPHLYGALNADAVVDVVDFAPDADGVFVLPPAI